MRIGGLVVNRRSPADQGEFLAGRRVLEEEALAGLLLDVPVIQLPLLATEVTGLAGVEAFARLL